ncbi:MAG: L,D-transpeptidase family protein [Gammaproteobacteria bacterium]|nr:L,D-transpeptidase family protein [Gammaproteobacteria bacterium]
MRERCHNAFFSRSRVRGFAACGSRSWALLLCIAALSAGVALPARAQEFVVPANGDNVVGGLQWVSASYEDTLLDIARRFNVGYREIRQANPRVDVWLPGEGTEVLIPSRYILPDAPREGIVINLSEMRLYYFPDPAPGHTKRVITHPISIGRVDWSTPIADTRVAKKVLDPTWYPPASIRAEYAERGEPLPAKVPPGPDNPLGRFALRLALPGYLIHGTNKPYGIGMRVTHGCVRMYPEDIETLFERVPVGTPVHIVNQPFKAGWRQGLLFLEAHPPEGNPTPDMLRDLTPAIRRVVAATPERGRDDHVDWSRVKTVAEGMDGIPLPVSHRWRRTDEDEAMANARAARLPTQGP